MCIVHLTRKVPSALSNAELVNLLGELMQWCSSNRVAYSALPMKTLREWNVLSLS